MMARAVTLSVFILAAGAYGARTAGQELPVTRTPLASLPRTLGGWSTVADMPLDANSIEVLRADDYLDRTYADTAEQQVNLYVAYYGSQRQGDTMHSPQNCLPGSGWQPIASSRTAVDVNGRAIPVNRYVIERAGERQLAYYWYQGRGRIVASEYANKFWLIADAARLHRSNGALVRVMAPIRHGVDSAAAEASAAAFVRQLFPHLASYLP
jgi:EpsI family protein